MRYHAIEFRQRGDSRQKEYARVKLVELILNGGPRLRIHNVKQLNPYCCEMRIAYQYHAARAAQRLKRCNGLVPRTAEAAAVSDADSIYFKAKAYTCSSGGAPRRKRAGRASLPRSHRHAGAEARSYESSSQRAFTAIVPESLAL